jgi:hypothetical protein
MGGRVNIEPAGFSNGVYILLIIFVLAVLSAVGGAFAGNSNTYTALSIMGSAVLWGGIAFIVYKKNIGQCSDYLGWRSHGHCRALSPEQLLDVQKRLGHDK